MTSRSDAMQPITTADECLRKDLLAWVFYPFNPNETVVFVWPRFVIDQQGLVPIDPVAFPDIGNVVGFVAAGRDSGDVNNRYGDITVMRFNTDELRDNPQSDNKSRYVANLNMTFQPGKSELEFKQFGKHAVAHQLMQIIEVDGLPGLGEAPEGASLVNNSGDVMCDYALLLYHDRYQDRLVGPVSCKSLGKEGQIALSGAEDYDYRVYEFVGKPVDEIRSLTDQDNHPVFTFVPAVIIDNAIGGRGFIQVHDWLPKRMLAEAMSKILEQSEESREYGKNALRRLRRGLQASTEIAAGFNLDDGRRERLLALAADVEYFATLPEMIQDSVFEHMTNEQLAEIVLAPRNFPRFKDQVINVPELQEAIQEKAAQIDAQIDKYRAQENAARVSLEEVQGQLAEAKASLAQLQQQAVEERTAELEELEQACEGKRAEVAELERSIAELQASKDELGVQLDRLVAMLEDKVELSAEVLKSEVVQRVVSLAGGSAPSGAVKTSEAISAPSVILPKSERKQLVDHLFDVVAERSGRSYQKNDVINFYTCLTQGYITTFAGMPGTGKTSLCRLLAKGLGLDAPGAGRFVELSVERGWTSFRDYIGYYNPLTRTEEYANREVFEALARLSDERDAAADAVAPCVLLLDEANLSPIEHYWAPFLKACDSFDQQPTTLAIGGNRSLLLPRHTRFLATVNYDHTTEELSPRFLDRSWVIMLNPEEVLASDDVPAEDEPTAGMVSYADLVATFGKRATPTMDNAIETVFTDVRRVCAAHRHPISPRSQTMMRNYICTANDLMETGFAANRYDPIDFAVAQKVLPGISGPRENCEALLDDLAAACSGLPQTLKIIDNMKSSGETSGYYQFFA